MAEESSSVMEESPADGGLPGADLPRWVLAIIPLVLLGALLAMFVITAPLSGIGGGEPLPDLTVTHHTLPDDETVVVHVTNNGPDSVTISQVLVDDAYWSHEIKGAGGDRTLAPRESARVEIPYHWNPGWDLEVALVLEDGATVSHEIVAPQQSPGVTGDVLWTLAIIGIFVGVIPVALGMLWFPFMKSMSDRALHALLIFAAGVLAFLAVDAGFEALELTDEIPGVYEGKLLVITAALGALLLVQSVSSWRQGKVAAGDDRAQSGLWLAYLVALGIGLHNLAEGLAIGSSFALGRTALGTFLVIGFMLHNVTEGPAIVAPVASGERPAVRHFGALGLIAGAPVILGGWIGGFVFTPMIGAVFLAVGVGAIVQVDWEIISMVRDQDGRVGSATNLLAFLGGVAVMYFTDIFVAI